MTARKVIAQVGSREPNLSPNNFHKWKAYANFLRFSSPARDPHSLNFNLQTCNPQHFNVLSLHSNGIDIIT